MCFSAPVSFAVSAVLLPVGVYALAYAQRHDRRYLALASFPLLFGIQQAFEGWLWLNLAPGSVHDPTLAALGFLFFAYLLWPGYVPFAARRIEADAMRRYIFAGFGLLGLLFGLSLYLPLLLQPDWLSVSIVHRSILYEPVLIYDGLVPRTAVRVFYAVIVAVPLLLTTRPALRRFGILVLLSVVISAAFFVYAFVSIWCFFAALLSLYIVVVLRAHATTTGSRSALRG